MRIWLLTNAPSPYQVEFLEELGKQEEVSLSVRLMRDRFRGGLPFDRSQHPNFLVMQAIGLPGENDEFRFHPRAVMDALSGSFDCFILSGLYTSPTFLLAAILLFLRRKPIVLWLERPGNRTRPRSFAARIAANLRNGLRSAVLRFLFRLSNKVICIGALAAKQYQQIGLPVSKTAIVPYCSNTQRFSAASDKATTTRKSSGKNAKPFQFLFSGQLIPRKGIDILLEIFRKTKGLRSEISLTILGDGPQRNLVEAARTSMPDSIQLLGHVDQSQLPELFASADAFLFPSRHDGWGVVINEACAAGLPILASEETGAAHDLVEQEQNGFRIPCDDTDQWVDRMVWMIDHQDRLSEFRQHSLTLSSRCSTSVGAANMTRVLVDLIGKS